MLDTSFLLEQHRNTTDVTPSAALSVRELTLTSARAVILDSLSFDLLDRETLCLIGPQGGGKSMLLRCLNRTAEEQRSMGQSGKILLEGRDINDPSWDAPQVRRQIGLVPAQANPFPTSIWENLLYVLKLHRLTGKAADLETQIIMPFLRLGVWDLVKDHLHRDPVHRMEPMLQRLVCMARALIQEPRVLLLDEPPVGVGGLEPSMLEGVLERLKSEIPIILVTPLMTLTARVADRIAHLEAGRLLELDSAELLLTNPQNARTKAFVESHC